MGGFDMAANEHAAYSTTGKLINNVTWVKTM